MPTPVSYLPKKTDGCTMALVGAATAHECLSSFGSGVYLESDAVAEFVRVGFEDLIDPGVESGHTITCEVEVVGGTSWIPIRVQLIEARPGGDVVLWEATILAEGAWRTYVWELPVEATGDIQNYADLALNATQTAGAPGHTARIRQLKTDTPGVVDFRITRMAHEVLGEARAPRLLFTRMAHEVLGEARAPRLLFTRMAHEVLGKASPKLNVTRVGYEVLAESRAPFLNVTRVAHEVLGKNVYGTVVSPANLPTPVPNFFIANWSGELVLETTYSTGVLTAESGAEDRRINLDRPYRTQTARMTGLTKREAARLYFNLARHGQARSVQHLFCDRAKTTAPASGTSIPCSTKYRRFSNGLRVVIHTWGSDNRPANVFYAVVQLVQEDELVLSTLTPLPMTYPAGSRVYPVMDVELSFENEGRFVSDEVLDVVMRSTEIIGPGALFSTTTEVPVGMQQSNGIPIFDLPLDWSKGASPSYVRDGERFESGKSFFAVARGERPRLAIPLDMFFKSRAEAWRAIELFDYCRGRGKTYYVVAPEEVLTATAIAQTQIDVEAFGNFQDAQQFVRFLAIERTDGEIFVVAVTSVSDGGATWSFLFNDPGDAISLATTRRVALCHLCRMGTDTMTERWETDEAVQVSYTAVEVLREQAFPLTDLDETYEFVSSPEEIADLWLWLDSSVNVYRYEDGDILRIATPAHGENVGVWDPADVVGTPNPGRAFCFRSTSGQEPNFATFTNPLWTNGRPALQSHQTEGMDILGDDDFVDNAQGLTVFVVLRQTDDAEISNQFFTFLTREGVIEWEDDRIKLFETLDTVNTALWIQGLPELRTGEMMTLVFRFEPGVSARLYKGGLVIGQSPTPPTGLANAAASGRDLELYRSAGSSDGEYGDSQALRKPSHVAFAIYRRALPSSELNALGQYFKTRFGAAWQDVP